MVRVIRMLRLSTSDFPEPVVRRNGFYPTGVRSRSRKRIVPDKTAIWGEAAKGEELSPVRISLNDTRIDLLHMACLLVILCPVES